VGEDGTVWNCLDVLRDILEIIGSRILMSENGWNVIRIRDYAKFYDSYLIPKQTYDADGSLDSFDDMDGADYGVAFTGPQDRSTMVGWIDGTQRVRYERAYKSIDILQDYGYRSLLMLGNFNSENWEDFWGTGGAPVREQSGDNKDEYHINIGSSMATAYIQQIIENYDWTVGDTVPRYILSFEAMVDYADTSSYTELFFNVRVFHDSTTNYYLDGQIGGSAADDPAWQSASILNTLFTTDNDLPESKVWYKFELTLPAVPNGLDGDTMYRFLEGTATGSGTLNSWNVRKCKLMFSYDLTPAAKDRDLALEISPENMEIMTEKTLGLGDVTVDNNEGILYFNSLSTDDTGETPTIEWRATRISGASRPGHGPIQPIADFVRDGHVIQHGEIRKRLSGRIVLDNRRWIMLSLTEDSVQYLFTRLTIDLKRGEADVSLLELPETGPMGDNLIEGWTNAGSGVGFDTFTSSGEDITSITHTTGLPAYADADDAISYKGYDQFFFKLEGAVETNELQVVFAGSTYMMNTDYEVVANAPLTPGSSTPRLQAAVNPITAVSDIVISIRRIYGH